LVIRGGEIRLPGEHVEMKDIGLPPGVVYAGLAETITLALRGALRGVHRRHFTPMGQGPRNLSLGAQARHAACSDFRC
jgi:hypothetical protein